MKTSKFKFGLVLLFSLFMSVSMFANTENPPSDEGKVKINVTEEGTINSTSVAECCAFLYDFEIKRDNALKVLTLGYGKEVGTSSAGDFVYHDFRLGNKQVARLVVNEKDKVLMLVTHDFSK